MNKEKKRCIYCNRTLRLRNRLNICSPCSRNPYYKKQFEELKSEFDRHKILCDMLLKDYAEKECKFEKEKEDLLNKLEEKKQEMCKNERPARKTFCQLEKGHKGSHQAVIFWESENEK